MSSLVLFIIITFLAGIYFCAKPSKLAHEGFSLSSLHHHDGNKVKPDEARCPNLLIQKGTHIFLYDSKVATVPGVNPVVFENLEDYVEFLDWQRSEGIHCPVLFLQHGYDAQGYETYKVRPDILDPQGGIPPVAASALPSHDNLRPTPEPHSKRTLLVDSTRDDKPFNQGNYPGYDATPYYVGMETPLDKMNEEVQNSPKSPNPMDDNWGGATYTQELVDKGYYKGNEVNIYIP